MLRYYRGDEGYKTSGPPPLLLRLLRPLVVLTSLTLLVTGTTLVLTSSVVLAPLLLSQAGGWCKQRFPRFRLAADRNVLVPAGP